MGTDMNIVVTGAKGFIGKNLCVMLKEHGYHNVVEADRETTLEELAVFLANADFVFHLAGINRPKNEAEFITGNTDLTQFITEHLGTFSKKVPLVVTSSIQAKLDNPYGRSKQAAEKIVAEYGERTSAPYYIYRFPNVFGKWCRPNYNSFVATFCYNILNNQDITVHDPSAPVTLVYIDDVCRSLISLLQGQTEIGYRQVEPEYSTTVGEVAEMLRAFKDSRDNLVTEDVGSGLTRALYATYLSYMTPSQFSYTIPSYGDERGVFSEMLKTKHSGQFSFFTAHPGITRGGHYHHSKNEKFLVLKGQALFKFEHIVTGDRHELCTNGNTPQIVETVPGWSHDITNVGDDELIVMLWANEIFDRDEPDTIARPL
ncbi:UDP-2-acetamido-2,6-beta-L-arabino-hexul-4-ose reductase [Shewanella carassii]|uniref:UDP-2-acetamido-2,6-dideoxy-beta-L-talose 4-dehydrogenase n=1 Tax=Shewanella carassii TaxID=1987584 RepID=A0ABQ1SZP9_9GAMM|nr:capsular polysaccharide biosynthesis protein CapF [Shewanella carassii]GGE70066.1 UDP-2-acetamido-2,6-dideoxy-beta-L-talose 4-dehydrogenase [Shewanella carassii]